MEIEIRGKSVLGVILEIPAGWQDPSGAMGPPYQSFIRIWVGNDQLLPKVSQPGSEGTYVALSDFHNYVPTPMTMRTTPMVATIFAYTTDPKDSHTAGVVIFTDEE